MVEWARATWAALEGLMVGSGRKRVREDLAREFNKCQRPETSQDALVNALLLDGKGTLRFAERLDEWRTALEGGERGKRYNRTFFASLYRDQLELERSTALLAEQSRADSGQAHELRKLGGEIEVNEHILALMHSSKNPQLVREMLLLDGYVNSEPIIKKFLLTSPPAQGYRYLLHSRHVEGTSCLVTFLYGCCMRERTRRSRRGRVPIGGAPPRFATGPTSRSAGSRPAARRPCCCWSRGSRAGSCAESSPSASACRMTFGRECPRNWRR